MSLVQISDVVVPEVFANYMAVDTTEKSALFRSGAIQMDAQMGGLMSGGGITFQHPFFKDLDNTEGNIASDDPNDILIPRKISTAKHRFIRQFRTQGWSTADLTVELAGADPMKRISSRVSEYWARQFDRSCISTIKGLIADNVANDSGDMVYDVTNATGTVTVGNKTVNKYSLYADVILEGKQTMGDNGSALALIVMHSRLFTNLQQQNLIAFIPNSQGVLNIPTYMGYEVLVSDMCPADDQGGGTIYYTTYLLGRGVLGWTEKPPQNPVAVKREETQGGGAGVEILITRRQYALHPYGFDWTDTSRAAQFPTNAELETASNWDRVYPERKQVPIVVIKTKNG